MMISTHVLFKRPLLIGSTLLLLACGAVDEPQSPTAVVTVKQKPGQSTLKTDTVADALKNAEQLLAIRYEKIPVKTQDSARQTLQQAYKNIDAARAMSPQDPRINSALNSLEKKYLEFIEASAADRAYSCATYLIEDAKALNMPQVEMAIQQESIGKAILKKARTIERL